MRLGMEIQTHNPRISSSRNLVKDLNSATNNGFASSTCGALCVQFCCDLELRNSRSWSTLEVSQAPREDHIQTQACPDQ